LLVDDNLSPPGEHVLDLTQQAPPLLSDHLRLGGTNLAGETLAFTSYYLTRNGRPSIPIMGEFHFARFPRQYWEQALQKIKAGGVTIVATYVFWIYVEEEEGVFDWSGDRDVRAFLEICQRVGLEVLLRIGPFVHGECRNGGLPDWLYARGIAVRSNDETYLAYVRRYFAEVGKQVEGLYFKDNGPVLGLQLDNEYMHCGAPWEVTYSTDTAYIPAGSDGGAHLQALKQIAQDSGFDVPIYSCTAWVGSPVPGSDFLPMHGGYAFTPWIPDPAYVQPPTREFLFRNRYEHPIAPDEVTYDALQYPYVCCELGTGSQISYNHRSIVPPECVLAMAVVALAGGSNWLGYYMYHGGSNPIGKHNFLNEHSVPRISYDFQAPLREYGQVNASYHYLRTLHLFLHEFGALLAPMQVALPALSEQIAPDDTQTLRYAARHNAGSGFLFLNNYQDHVTLAEHKGVRIRLELADESLTVPQHPDGFTLRAGVSAILPFNLRLADTILLKYATAQLLTRVHTDENTTYVFFAPDGLVPEFALDRTTYHSLELTGGTFREEDDRCYVTVEPGLAFSLRILSLTGSTTRLLVLTQQQALSCWKTELWGVERLLLADEALYIDQKQQLHCSWRGPEEQELSIYPPLAETEIVPVTEAGTLALIEQGLFSRYRLTLPERSIAVRIEHLSADTISIKLPALEQAELQESYLCIDYLGDTGQMFLDGLLVADNFANGSTWEIGLKRFLLADKERELILRISPLLSQAKTLSSFPAGMAYRPVVDGNALSEVSSITALPEYHFILSQQPE
jgi:beta-galactosidase